MVHPLVTLLMTVAVEVVGPSTCPEPADVTTALSRLPTVGSEDAIGEGPPEGPRLIAEIRQPAGTGAGLSITLRTQDGAVLAERVIAESGSCPDLAAAAAVVIAAWQRGLRPDLGPDLPRSAPGAIAAKPGPTTVTAAPTPSDWPMELGVAALAAAAARDLSPGLQVDATIGSFGWGLGPRLVGSIESPHGTSLGPVPGKTLWSRSTLGVGVRKRSVVGAFMVDAQAHVKAALVRVRGAGFDENYTGTGTDVGGGLGVQIGWPYRWFAPFLGLGATLWAGRKTAEVTGTAAETTLPRFDVSLALGVSVGRFR